MRPTMPTILTTLAAFRLLAADLPVLCADEAITPAALDLGRPVNFETDIAPIFRANCVACHNKAKREGDLIIEDVASILRGGGSGDVVIPGKPDDSYLYNVAARVEESYMPPLPNTVQAKALTPRELGLLRQWIAEGAKAGTAAASSQLAWQSINAGLQAIYAVDTDAAGKFVAAGRGGNVTVYDLHATDHAVRLVDPQLATLPRQQTHRDYVNAIAFSPVGEVLATAGYRNIKLWRRESVRDDASASSDVSAEAARPLTVMVNQEPLTVTRTVDGAVFTAEVPPGGVVTSAFATRNENLVLLLLENGTVQSATLSPGKLTLGAIVKSAAGKVTDIQAGGEVILFHVGNALEVRSADAGTLARTITAASGFRSVSLSPDGQRVAAVNNDGLSQLWNTADGKLIASLQVNLPAQQQQDRCRITKDMWNARVNVVQAQIKEAEKRVAEQNDSVKKAKEAVTKTEEEVQKAKTKQDEEAKKVAAAQEQLKPKPDDAGLKKRVTDAMAAKAKADEVFAAAEARLKSNRRGVELSEQAVQRATDVVAAAQSTTHRYTGLSGGGGNRAGRCHHSRRNSDLLAAGRVCGAGNSGDPGSVRHAAIVASRRRHAPRCVCQPVGRFRTNAAAQQRTATDCGSGRPQRGAQHAAPVEAVGRAGAAGRR